MSKKKNKKNQTKNLAANHSATSPDPTPPLSSSSPITTNDDPLKQETPSDENENEYQSRYKKQITLFFKEIYAQANESEIKIFFTDREYIFIATYQNATIKQKKDDNSVITSGFQDKEGSVIALLTYFKGLAKTYKNESTSRVHTWKIEQPKLSDEEFDRLKNKVFATDEDKELLKYIQLQNGDSLPAQAREIPEEKKPKQPRQAQDLDQTPKEKSPLSFFVCRNPASFFKNFNNSNKKEKEPKEIEMVNVTSFISSQ